MWNCSCGGGYIVGGDGACHACEAGLYRSPSMSACSLCPSSTYAGNEPASFSCTPCPMKSTSPAGSINSSQCSCVPGYYKINRNSQCVACAAGKYNSQAGATSESACLNCTEHSASDEQASVSVAQCVCDKGYIGNGTVGCVACSRGSYKDVNGSAACTLCAAGKFSETLAARAEAACLNCNTGSYSLPGSGNSTQCVCNRCGEIGGARARACARPDVLWFESRVSTRALSDARCLVL